MDDDLTVLQGEKELFVDDDRLRSDDPRPMFVGRTLTYRREPVVLVPDPAQKLPLRATDHFATEAVLGPIWVHRWDGVRKKLTGGVAEESASDLPHVYFDRSFSLTEGLEAPERLSRDPAEELPDRPASLLRR